MFFGKRDDIKSAFFCASSCQMYFPLIGTSSSGGLNETSRVKQTPSPPSPSLNSTDNKPCGLCCATSSPNIS